MLKEELTDKRRVVLLGNLKAIVIAVSILCSFLSCILPAYAADGGNVTWGQVFRFIENNFSDTNMQNAVRREIEKYYSWSEDEDDLILNDTGIGPEEFADPEEVLSWVGAMRINTKTDGIKNVEGLQYIGKDYLLDTRTTNVCLVLDGGICLQELFGELWTNKTELYCLIDHNITDVYSTGYLSTDGYLDNSDYITLPIFWASTTPTVSSSALNSTSRTPLTYLRDGTEKRFFVYGSVTKYGSGKDLTQEGVTYQTNIPSSFELKDAENKKWELISNGKDETNIRWNLTFNNWDRYMFNKINGKLLSVPVLYNYTYWLQVGYYSSVDIQVNSEIYGGFTYSKVSENNSDIKLSGAQFVVSDEKGEYLVAEGKTDTPAVFDADITKAKIYTTDTNGTFEVDKIPVGRPEDATNEEVTADYYVTEIKATPGYQLDSTPKKVKVMASTEGIQMTNTGGETGVTINSDDMELTPQWKNGKEKPLVLLDGRETKNEKHAPAETHALYIKNSGKQINKLKYETDNAKFEVLQSPDFIIKDLNASVVGEAKTLKDAKELLNNIITKKKMQSVSDSYKAEAQNTLIYYDKESIKANSNEAAGNENYQIKNKPLPVAIKFRAKKVFDGDVLGAGDFQFTMDSQVKNNKPDGSIEFDEMSFDSPGTYTYQLRETDQWYQGNPVKDIIFDPTEHTIQINVEETGKDGLKATIMVDGLEKGTVTSVECWKVNYPHLNTEGKIVGKDISSVEESKDREPVDTDVIFKNTRTQLLVKKIVKGNMGDKTKEFTFQMELNAPSGTTLPNELEYEITNSENLSNGNGKKGTIALNDGRCTFQLAHDEQILFKGIPVNCQYSIEEVDGKASGYTVTSNHAQGVMKGKEEVTFTNEKNISIPTLASMNTKILIAIAIAALSVGVFMKGCYKKQRKEGRDKMGE